METLGSKTIIIEVKSSSDFQNKKLDSFFSCREVKMKTLKAFFHYQNEIFDYPRQDCDFQNIIRLLNFQIKF